MLGLFLIYFIGNNFYKLAAAHEKHRWGYAILGVISYYAGTIAFGLAAAVYYELVEKKGMDSGNEMALNFIAIPFGVLACWGLYKYLKYQWSKPAKPIDPTILDSSFLEQK